MAAKFAAGLPSISEFTLQGYRGKACELEIAKPFRGFASVHEIVVKGPVDQLMVMSPTLRASLPQVRHFFDSFQLTSVDG
jgi:hypothetical protein